MTIKKRTILAAAVVALAGSAGVWSACRGGAERNTPAPDAVQAQYHCPMHPTYVSDKPGNCPICSMKLVKFESPAPGTRGAGGPRKIAYYRSPMDPSVHSASPARDSMGMDFVPVYEDELTTGGVAGRGVVTLSAERRRVLGVRSEPVRRTSLARTIRTVGRVTPDERRLHHIHTKYEAYIEHLYVDYTGMLVKKGQALASLFSPELVATQQEYLLASRARKQLASSALPAVAQGGVDLLEAARGRLLLWDIREEDIARLEETGEVRRTLDLYSPVSGYVTQKMALHGMRVTPTDTLFDIADLSWLWVLADVYESDLAAVRLGMPAELTLSYLPGRTWRGDVTYVAPTVEEKTRTIKVRIEVDNADGQLKPDMFADVLLRSGLGIGLVVPESALLRTGERTLVFADLGEGRLEPREVKVGAKVADGVQVVSGVAEGERVVTAANFLLDSESSIKAALSALQPAGTPSSVPPSPAGHVH
ncbi:MAG TPA: efflux RND transporter periplasmic adaptor subunit [Vicinamibacteria bacterium]|nr:efflux RND transporter periplasmic adaptor subunit [Vicinamibacteria bacterium]